VQVADLGMEALTQNLATALDNRANQGVRAHPARASRRQLESASHWVRCLVERHHHADPAEIGAGRHGYDPTAAPMYPPDPALRCPTPS
jgi:hypothetical protein